jgi:cell division protein FtsN
MRILVSIIISSVLLTLACNGTKKRLRESGNSAIIQKEVIPPIAEIKELEEKLVPIDEKLPDTHRYFVIIGSFRNPNNAEKYRGQILKKRFTSVILKNEAGLYRVSVLSTDEIETARDDVRRIRRVFPEYYDTWLLIQKK